MIPEVSGRQCKLCLCGKRAEIDALLLRRSLREKTPEGTAINFEYVRARMLELGVENPTEENVKNHWKKHCRVVTEEAAQAQAEQLNATIEAFQKGERVSDDDFLELVKLSAYHRLQAELLGVPDAGGATLDQGLKAIGEKTKRKGDEGANLLLRSAAGAMSLAVRQAEQATIGPARPHPDVIVVEREPALIEAGE